VQVFDVNETLLDLAAFDPHFQRVFGDAGMRRVWFQQMIQSALVATVTGPYRTFGEIGLAALAMTAEQAGVAVGADSSAGGAANIQEPIVGGQLKLGSGLGLQLRQQPGHHLAVFVVRRPPRKPILAPLCGGCLSAHPAMPPGRRSSCCRPDFPALLG